MCYNSSAVFAFRDLNVRGQLLLDRMREHTARLQQQAEAMLAFASACEVLPALQNLGPMRDTAEGTEVALHGFFAEAGSVPAVQGMEAAAKQAAEAHTLAAAAASSGADAGGVGHDAGGLELAMAGDDGEAEAAGGDEAEAAASSSSATSAAAVTSSLHMDADVDGR